MATFFPIMRGIIDRRILINFRVRPGIVKRFLPAPFEPKLVRGWAICGICLIRLKHVWPRGFPAACSITSENAAHRVAVEWDEASQRCEGVFILRRDTNSLLNQIAGGHLFPGAHHGAKFEVWETDRRFKLEMRSVDGQTFIRVAARVMDGLSVGSVFPTHGDASDFFQAGALGWSVGPKSHAFEGLELRCDSWRMESLAIERVQSSFFENTDSFPPGTVEFDSAFLMRNVEHEWHRCGTHLPISKM